MGGKIGDYIHLTAEGYNRSGIYRTGKHSPSYNFAVQKYKIKNRMTSYGVDTKELKSIEDNLNMIFKDIDPNSDSEADQQILQIQNIIANKLNEEFQSKMGHIDFSTGNITSVQIVKKRVEALKAIETSENYTYLSTIMKRIAIINANKEQIQSVTDKAAVEKTIGNIMQDLQKIFAIEEQTIKNFLGVDPSTIKSGYGRQLDMKKLEKTGIITEINKIVKAMGSLIPINSQKGALFEYAAALSQLVGQKLTTENTKEAIKAAIGTKKENVHFNPGNFSSEFVDLKQVGLKAIIDKETGSEVYISGSNSKTQGKVDIQFNLKNGKQARISAKNVNLQSGYFIHLVSGTSLLFLLQDEPADFVNHYLNLAASHNDEDDKGTINTADLAAARAAVKMTVFAKALAGGASGRNSANIFLVNDNSKTGGSSIRAFNIGSIIRAIYNDLDSFTEVTSGSLKDKTLENIDNYSFKNSRAEGEDGMARISKLLADVHSKKINVALNPSLLNKLK